MSSKSSDYDVGSISKKPLKLKSDSGKVHKKKKKKKDKKKKMEKVDLHSIQEQDPSSGPSAPKYKPLTPAEEKFKRVQEKRQMDRILKKASKGHKERVEEFNRHLDSLSEHYDIPKLTFPELKMVNVIKGILVECDPPMKQFLLYLDDTNALGKKFILQDLDETHLFIAADMMDRIQKKIDELMDYNSYAIAQQQT